jgi:hypothetical protein
MYAYHNTGRPTWIIVGVAVFEVLVLVLLVINSVSPTPTPTGTGALPRLWGWPCQW